MNWETIAALGTALGTLVLALATFASVRSAQRAARVAERSLLLGIRPLLVTTRSQDLSQEIGWGDGFMTELAGGMGHVSEATGGGAHLAISVRNVGSGLAVILGWYPRVGRALADLGFPEPDEFRPQRRDLYVAPGDVGFWQASIREEDDEFRRVVREAAAKRERLTIELLYGDYEGGQLTISRFGLEQREGDVWAAVVTRHRGLDRPDPRADD